MYFSLCRISKSDSVSSAAKKFSQLIDIYTGKTSHTEPCKSKISGKSEPKIHTVQELKELLGVANEPSSFECVDSSSQLSSEFITSQTKKTIAEEGKCSRLSVLITCQK